MMNPFPLVVPGMHQDANGFMRYPPQEHDARARFIESSGQPISMCVEMWLPLKDWQPMDHSLFVILIHPGEGFVHMCSNPEEAPWQYHLSLCRLGEVTPDLTQDLFRIIAHAEGWSGVQQIWRVCGTGTHVPSWHCPALSPIWGEVSRLRAAGGHPGCMSWSA